MILYKNTKAMVHSPDGDTTYFDIVAGVLQGDTLIPYLFIICNWLISKWVECSPNSPGDLGSIQGRVILKT